MYHIIHKKVTVLVITANWNFYPNKQLDQDLPYIIYILVSFDINLCILITSGKFLAYIDYQLHHTYINLYRTKIFVMLLGITNRYVNSLSIRSLSRTLSINKNDSEIKN